MKIESIKPNRLKINLTFDTKKLSSSKPDIQGEMQVNWLHGAIAANLKARVTVTLTEAPTIFAKYPAFQFTDPAKSFSMEEMELYEGYLDESGKTSIPGRFSVDQSAPGMLNANFTTRVFEKSGDFSIDRFSIPYSPYSAYVGMKTPEGDKRGMLLTDTTHWVDVVLLDENGTPCHAVTWRHMYINCTGETGGNQPARRLLIISETPTTSHWYPKNCQR